MVTDAPHSISKQSYADPYLPGMRWFKHINHRNPKWNLDGYGIYYRFIENDQLKLHKYKSKNPIVNIDTFETNKKLKDQTQSKDIYWATIFIRNNNFKDKYPNTFQSVQPFKFKNYLFSHNGGFNTHLKNYLPKIKKYIKNKKYYDKQMENINVDSRWLFSLFLNYVNSDNYENLESLKKDIEKFLHIMHKIKDNDFNISMNLLFTNLNNDTQIILRYRTCNQLPPTLYYNKVHPLGYFVSSEPIDFEPGWKLMRNQLIIIKDDQFKSYKLSPKTINCVKT